MQAKYTLLGSAVALALGGYLLIGVVPLFLTVGTYVEVVLLLLSYALYERSPFRVLAHVLNVLLLATFFSPAHFKAYAEFGRDAWITALDLLSFLAFGVFPVLYFFLLLRGRAFKL